MGKPILRWAIVGGLVVAVVVAARVRTLGIPLERDEGEYAYIGQLWLQGAPPYVAAANIKLPGTYAAYALIMAVLGQSTQAIHAGLLLANLAAVALLLLLARSLLDPVAAVIAAASYALLSLSPLVLGTAGHATHFVVLFALLGLCLLRRQARTGQRWLLVAGGAALGLAILMKQAGVVFAAAGLCWLLLEPASNRPGRPGKLRSAALLTLGTAIPYAAVVGYYALIGHLPEFWRWTVINAWRYGGRISPVMGIRWFAYQFFIILQGTFAFWLFALIGLALAVMDPRRNVRLIALSVLSFSGVCFGFYFRAHYFILALPAAAMLIGLFLSRFEAMVTARARHRAFGLSALVIFLAATASYGYWHWPIFVRPPEQVSRYIYGYNPFPESAEVGRYLKDRTSRDDRIIVFGSEPEIYFYAQRRSPVDFLYAYDLMFADDEARRLRDQSFRQLSRQVPLYAVMVDMPISWFEPAVMVGKQVDLTYLDQIERYLQRYYHLADVVCVDDRDPSGSIYSWKSTSSIKYGCPHSQLLIYRRND